MNQQVKIYSAPTCPYCKKLKSILTKMDIDYVEHDVTENQDLYREMIDISGGFRSVPVLVAGDEIVAGFDKKRIINALNNLISTME